MDEQQAGVRNWSERCLAGKRSVAAVLDTPSCKAPLFYQSLRPFVDRKSTRSELVFWTISSVSRIPLRANEVLGQSTIAEIPIDQNEFGQRHMGRFREAYFFVAR